jgi:prepilin-type N-terminal cleavage/methylation domain-containing protein
MQETEKQKGWTLIEILSVCVIIGMILAFALPSYMQGRRVTYEDNAISRMERIALAESRYYGEYGRFGDFTELVTASYLPNGYSTVYQFTDPMSMASVLPYIDRYSLTIEVPRSANSLYYQVNAIPVGYNRMGLRTFNINMYVTGTTNPDNLLQLPPVREGLDPDGQIVSLY